MATWVITGGNRGIGLELVESLLSKGNKVIAGMRNPEDFTLEHANLTTLYLDVKDTNSANEFGAKIASITDTVDVLVNNAGMMDGRWQSFEDVDMEQSLEVLNVNTIGPMRVTQSLWPIMKSTPNSKVAMITSLMGSIDDCMSGRSYAYRTSKTGLNMITKVLSIEGRDHDITVTCYHPGWVKTDMGGEMAPVTKAESVEGLMSLINNQTMEKSGRFFEYTGVEFPW